MDSPEKLRTPGPFPSTMWTVIGQAGQDDENTVWRDALGAIYANYYPALRAYLMSTWRGLSPTEIEEILQEFMVERVVKQRLLSKAARGRGRFRYFIRTALRHYVIDRYRRLRARGLETSIDIAGKPDLAGNGDSTAFDTEWARTVVMEAVRRMKEQCERLDQSQVWGVFFERLVKPMVEGARAIGYGELVTRYSIESPAKAQNLLVTAKRKYQRCLVSVIREYETNAEAATLEIADLIAILSTHNAGTGH